MIKVNLDRYELELAANWGCQKRINAILGGMKLHVPTQKQDIVWYHDITGAMAEYAVAKHFNKFIGPNIPQFKNDDIRGMGGIKSSDNPTGRLLLKRGIDKPTTTYIFVTFKLPVFTLVGHIFGEKAMVEKYWDTRMPTPCFAIPQSDLIPFTDEPNLF